MRKAAESAESTLVPNGHGEDPADLDDLDDEEQEPAPAPEADPAVELEDLWSHEVAGLLQVICADPLRDREIVLAFHAQTRELPNYAELRAALHVTFSRMARWGSLQKKHGLWMHVPEDVRESRPERAPSKKAGPVLSHHLNWPPMHEPCGQLLDAGEGQGRMWIRCSAGLGCHVRNEVLLYTIGLSLKAVKGLVAAEVAQGYACPPHAIERAQREAEQARRLAVRPPPPPPNPAPSAIAVLLQQDTAAADQRVRDLLFAMSQAEGPAREAFPRLLDAVFSMLDAGGPKAGDYRAAARHGGRVAAFRHFFRFALPVRPPAPALPPPRPRPRRKDMHPR